MKSLWVLSMFLLYGCTRSTTPDICLPPSYIEGSYVESCMEEEDPVDLNCWWRQFDDPLLVDLIQRGISCNHNLRIARERIWEARAHCGTELSNLLPQIDASVVFNRMRNSQTLSDSPFTGGTFDNVYQAGFDSIWEIDLFGKYIDRTKAAALDVVASIEEVRAVHVSVAGEIATNYFTIRALQERIRIAQNHIVSETELVSLVEARYEAGLISELDLYAAKAILEERYALVPQLTIDLYKTIYQVAVLIGVNPEMLFCTFNELREQPCRGGKIPLGLPSDLLCRRGDIRKAELSMRAAGARVSSAKKELFPTLSLQAFYSYATGFFNNWKQSASRQWSVTPLLLLPIFHGGEILSHIRAETSIQRQRVLEYEQSVLKALEEVEGSLLAYCKEGVRLEALTKEVNHYKQAQELALTLYTAGIVDFAYVLEIEKDLFLTQNIWAESKAQLLRNLVAIYKALGGGWEC